MNAQARIITSWIVPIEVALACPTGSAMRAAIQARRDAGDLPQREATLHLQHGRFFVSVGFYGPDRPDLFMPLDVWEEGR